MKFRHVKPSQARWAALPARSFGRLGWSFRQLAVARSA